MLALGPLDASSGTLEIALAHGLVFAAMFTAVSHISGGHFNPAITFGVMVTRRIPILLGLSTSSSSWEPARLPRCSSSGSSRQRWRVHSGRRRSPDRSGPGLVVEALLTFFLIWVFIALTADSRNENFAAVAGVAIGSRSRSRSWSGGPLRAG